MSSIQLQIMMVAILVSIASVLPGTFLVLRGVALMSDAISHAVLLGIAVMFLLVHNLDSPLLLIGAALAGLATVFLTESVIQTQCLKKDAAIGIVFPLFFSCGVILISLFARDVHLDVDMVILGEIAFAPFNRLILWGVDCGATALWSMGAIVLINLLFIGAFYKELKASLFDSDFAAVAGLAPTLLYYGLMMLTSVTAVGAFDIVGSIVVVALMITPPATAYVLVDRLEHMLSLSIVLSIITSLAGYWMAVVFDVSIAGAIATMSGIVFIVVLVAAPRRGLIARTLQEQKKKRSLAHDVLKNFLVLCPYNQSTPVNIMNSLGWSQRYTDSVIRDLIKVGSVIQKEGNVIFHSF